MLDLGEDEVADLPQVRVATFGHVNPTLGVGLVYAAKMRAQDAAQYPTRTG
jgi:hypothetical protein